MRGSGQIGRSEAGLLRFRKAARLTTRLAAAEISQPKGFPKGHLWTRRRKCNHLPG